MSAIALAAMLGFATHAGSWRAYHWYAAMSGDQRDEAVLRALDLDPRPFRLLRTRIGAGTSYSIRFSGSARHDDLAVATYTSVLRYWLLPALPAGDGPADLVVVVGPRRLPAATPKPTVNGYELHAEGGGRG